MNEIIPEEEKVEPAITSPTSHKEIAPIPIKEEFITHTQESLDAMLTKLKLTIHTTV